MDNKTLELFNYEGALKFPSMTGFSLLDLTEHTNSNGEDFWVDLFESLLNGYGMFLEYIIFSKRNKKLLSFFNKKQEYYPNLCVEKIKEYLKYCNHNIQLKE